MISGYEARKLQQDSKPELNSTPGTVWKCTAGLVGVVILALLGTANDPQRDSGGGFRPSGYLEAVAHEAPAAAAENGRDLEQPTPNVELVRHGL